MSTGAMFALGALAGALAITLLSSPNDCCARVGQGVSDKIGEELGAGAQAAFNVLGGRTWSPGLLSLFGVKP